MKPLILALALACGSAHAVFKDGNKLISDLNNTNPSQITPAIGLGYVMGIVDAYNGVVFCAPENMTAGQARDMVQNYLNNTPAVRHFPASEIVSHVFKSMWPCAANNNRRGSSL